MDNPEHTEFSQLKILLLQYLRKGLVMMTEVKGKRHQTLIACEQKKMTRNKALNFMGGIAVAVVLIVGINMRYKSMK